MQDISNRMGVSIELCRFIPYVMMYEFEALLFSDCKVFAESIGMPDIAATLSVIRNSFPSPEEINDSPQTAPSKRVESVVPGYQKPLFGNVVAHAIGLDVIRAECANFSDWLLRLEQRVR